jgi:ABC-type transport system substrate-binding protein
VTRSTMRARCLVPLLATVMAAGCGTASTPAASTSVSGTPAGTVPVGTAAQALNAPTPTPTPSASPTPAYADTLRIGVNVGLYRGWMVVIEYNSFPALTFGRLVYGSLYGSDGRGNAIPDLADGPCFVPGSDGAVIRCRLVETTFHDGTPLTADDVVYTYQVMNHPVLDNLFSFKEVRAVDARTVDFVFPSVDAACLECTLHTQIFSRRSIDEAVAAFDEAGLTAEGVDTLVEDLNAEIGADPPVCSDARVAEVDAIFQKLGFVGFPAHHEDLLKENGEFDACLWLEQAAWQLDTSDDTGGGSVGYALHQTGIDRVAAVLGPMLMGRPDIFVGTGPYRYVSQDAESVHFEAFPGYHGGMPATKYVDFVRAKADGSDVVAGTVDILSDAFRGVPFGRLSLGAAFEATAEAHGIHVLHLPGSNYAQLTFNVREGRLFSDVDLRKALQLCIELPRDVDAATGGSGIPIYSPVMPGSWGDDPDMPKPDRDVAAGKRLIEASGWTLGSDGVYAEGKLRLAARIIVRGGMADRVKMVDLIAAQARACGMDLESLLIDDYGDLLTYPHDIPGTKTPFDLLLVVYGTGVDPADSLEWFTSAEVSDEEHPDGGNMSGLSDPAFDRLLAEAGATYDQADRASLYRQAQEELAAQLPALFLWNRAVTDAVRPTVATIDGPLDLTLPNWAWQPERLVVTEEPAP